MNQMVEVFSVSPKVMKRWIRDLGLSANTTSDPQLRQRHEAFSRALEYANKLKAYPHGEEIEEMAVRTFPFHEKDLVELIETRPFRGFESLTDKPNRV